MRLKVEGEQTPDDDWRTKLNHTFACLTIISQGLTAPHSPPRPRRSRRQNQPAAKCFVSSSGDAGSLTDHSDTMTITEQHKQPLSRHLMAMTRCRMGKSQNSLNTRLDKFIPYGMHTAATAGQGKSGDGVECLGLSGSRQRDLPSSWPTLDSGS